MDNKKYGTKKLDDMSDPKNWEIWDAPTHPQVLYLTFPEFTCLCPKRGYPDFAKVHLIMVPDKKVLELQCLKLWLNSFRDRSIGHEAAAQEIAFTLFKKLKLQYIFIVMEYSPRGNLTTYPMTQFKTRDVFPEEVTMIKKLILEKLI